MSNVIQLHPDREPVGQFIRIGRGYSQLDALLGSGRLRLDRAVFNAGAVERQRDLLNALQAKHYEVVLDTTVAELSVVGRFGGACSRAPWAVSGRPLVPSDIEQSSFVENIARFAVKDHFSAVLSPTHFISAANDPLLLTDRKACINLHAALDKEGGRNIGLDYVLALPNRVLKDPAQRAVILQKLSGLPFENLWLRVSQFGADATGLGVRRYIEATQKITPFGHPIIIDGVAGLAALAVIAFGAAGGVAHGVGDMERFDASDWNTPPKEKDSFGLPTRVLVPALDRQLTRKQFDAIMAAPGGRKAILCSDVDCCPRGLTDMWQDPKAHYLYQRRRPLENLSSIPNLRRAQHFIEFELAAVERKARSFARLKISDSETAKVVSKESTRLERLSPILEHLHDMGMPGQRSIAPRFRASNASPDQRAQL